jgi:hypothetical protein
VVCGATFSNYITQHCRVLKLSLKGKNRLIKEMINEIVSFFAGTIALDMENFSILTMEISANIQQ